MVIKEKVPFILSKTDFENAYKDIFALGYEICKQEADWMVYVTPIRQHVYTDVCLAAAIIEGWIPNNRQKTPRASYVGYRSCNTEVTEFLLEIAKKRYEAVLEGGAAKLLGYLAEEVLDCVYREILLYLLETRARIRRITNYYHANINELKKASELILGKDEGWEKGEERIVGFLLLEFTEVLEESCLSVLPHILCEYLYDLAKKFNSYHSSVYEDGSVAETSTLLLYAATDVVMDKCFDRLGISPGVVLEKFSDHSGITLPSSLIESPMTVFRRALLLSTVERPMDLNARDPTGNFRFELFSFRITPGTPLWYDNKGLIFGRISATDKFGLRGSYFSEPDFAHVSLFNEDWRNPIRINDPGLVFDDKEEIDLSEFWDKKSDGLCGCLSIGSENGHTRFYYMLLRDAIDTALEIKFTTKMDGFSCEVRGYIVAHYGNDFLYESQSETETICKDSYMALLFRPEPPYVLTDGIIPLIKSVLAVPRKGSLIVKAYIEDAKSGKVIMDGCCKFKPLLEYGCISGGTIAGSDGCSLDLRVSWNFSARYL